MANKAVAIPDAFKAMRDTDDSIAEIDAMIPRFLKMKKQLIAQKEYIEVAINSAAAGKDHDGGSIDSSAAGASAGRTVDYRVNLYKHRSLIAALKAGETTNSGLLVDVLGTGHSDPDITKMTERAVKNGASRGTIFKSDQALDVPVAGTEATGEVQDTTAAVSGKHVFKGVDIKCTKQFLIGVNAILTHPNDISTSLKAKTDEIDVPYDAISAAGQERDFSTTTSGTVTGADDSGIVAYKAGLKHKLTAGVLKGLTMLGSTNAKTNQPLANTLLGTTLDNNDTTGVESVKGLVHIRGFGL
jgi:hypothetical protein